ncbi:addiction module protein [Prosthecobacter vanneervenii]|uniref:Putative addiction module component (TIGR02574 family) n=1 Tax=Prosthecobacter vanneervenii TaxID=48466 RepID=A0A7W7YAL6_9BACT|nr:addiction module protein [Prosthecobacter vanneervenii]MBB5032678.1 putative addiction module component (TIGR02574 family) [Prosthecobacter vanneervenii]
MILETLPAVRLLSPRDKRQLAEELLDSADAEDGEVVVDAAIMELLDRRLAAHAANPQAVSTWEEVQSRVFSGRGA